MGASGSGKSTLLTIAGSLEDPTSGEVYVGGRPLSSLSRNGKARLRRQSIGYVFQDYNLLAGLSAVENVSLPLELDGVSARKAQAAALESLEDFGLEDRASHYPDQLSGGERQRVAIARAVVGGRQLLLADEPSGALDSTNAEAVMRLILAACHRGLAAVVVTHDAQLASWADRVVFLRDGRVVDQTLPAREPRSVPRRPPEPMSVGVLERPVTRSAPEPTTGGVPARRAMIRWAWRLFKREWRQQLLILLLVIVAVAAVVVGAAVAVNTPPPANAGFGTAHDLATFNVSTPRQVAVADLAHVDAQIAALEHRFGTVQVIENETFNVPGSHPDLPAAVPGPARPLRRADAAAALGALPDRAEPDRPHARAGVRAQPQVGDTWSQGGKTVVGIVQNPQSLLDEFALVPPGQVTHPTQVSVLFDAPGVRPGPLGSNVTTPGSRQQQRDQSRDHRAGVGDRRHAPHRAGVDRRLHRAGAAPHARPRDARVHGGDRPQRPARAAGQRRHRRRRGRRGGLRAGPGGLVGLPPAQRAERAPPHPDVRPAVERDRAGDGARGRRDLLRRRATRPAPSPASRSSAPWPGARRRRARSTARSFPA